MYFKNTKEGRFKYLSLIKTSMCANFAGEAESTECNLGAGRKDIWKCTI